MCSVSSRRLSYSDEQPALSRPSGSSQVSSGVLHKAPALHKAHYARACNPQKLPRASASSLASSLSLRPSDPSGLHKRLRVRVCAEAIRVRATASLSRPKQIRTQERELSPHLSDLWSRESPKFCSDFVDRLLRAHVSVDGRCNDDLSESIAPAPTTHCIITKPQAASAQFDLAIQEASQYSSLSF